MIQAVVTEQGRLARIELLQPKRVEPEVEAALRQDLAEMRFTPATRQGKPVPVPFHLALHHCPHFPVPLRDD